MRIRDFVSYILFMLILLGCNVSEQDVPATRSSSGLGSETFFYNDKDLDLIENVTSVNIFPMLESNASYQILPSLPDGLQLNNVSGIISGVPTEELPETTFIIIANTSSGSKEYAQVTIEVLGEPPLVIDYGVSVLNFTQDVNASYALTVTGGAANSFTISPDLPAGLVLASDGTIGGTPTVASSEYYKVTAINDQGSASTTILINIADSAPTFDTTTPYSNDEQQVYTHSYTDTGITNNFQSMSPSLSNAPTNVSYKITPALPAGMSLDTSTGVISGDPTEKPAHTDYTVTAYNDTGSDSVEVFIYIHDIIKEFSYNYATKTGELGASIPPNNVATYTGGTPPTYTLICDSDANGIYREVGDSCNGITINSSTGLISGIPTAIGTVDTRVVVTYDESAPAAFKSDGVTPFLDPHDLFGAAGTGEDYDNDTVFEADEQDTYIETFDVSFKITEDYPSDFNQIGYSSEYTIYKDKAIILSRTTQAGGNPTSFKLADESYDTDFPGTCWTNFLLAATNECDLPIDGLVINYNTGQITGTPTSAADATIIIEGYNLDETGTRVKTSEQTVRIKVEVLAPQGISYYDSDGATVPASCSILSGTTDVYQCDYGVTFAPTWSPNIPNASGTPDVWTISPKLPSGLSFNTTTGEITGQPTEEVPNRYYFITASNDAGSYATSVAIDIDQEVPPTSLSYSDNTCIAPITALAANELDFCLFDYDIVLASYEGGPATFTATPTGANTKQLSELGLSIDSSTGAIYGTPIQSFEDGAAVVFTITASNTYGSISTDIQLDVANRTIGNLEFYASDENFNSSAQAGNNTKYRAILEVGDVITATDLLTSSDYDITNPAGSGGFIETYADISNAGYALSDYGLTLDTSTGVITGTVAQSAALSREKNLTYLRAQTSTPNNVIIQGSSTAVNSGAAIDTGTTFAVTVKEKAPVISYTDTGYGDNVILVKGDSRFNGAETESDSEYIKVTNSGGLIAVNSNGAATNACTATFISSREGNADGTNQYNIDQEYVDFYDTDASNTCTTAPCNAPTAGSANAFQFEMTNCSFRFLKNQCFSSGGKTGDTIVYDISATNSGTWASDEITETPVTRRITVHTYDSPNFIFEPDSYDPVALALPTRAVHADTELLYRQTQLTLNSYDLTGDTHYFTPYTGDNSTEMCHYGDYALDDLSDLPTDYSFNATDGTITTLNHSILGRRSFTLSATENSSGLSLTQTEDITVQGNHIEDISGLAVGEREQHTYEVKVMDINADGSEDFIVRSEECDDFTCTNNGTSIYIQDTTITGMFDGVDLALPAALGGSGSGITHITGFTYDSANNKAGILALSNNGTDISSYSTTTAAEISAAFDGAGGASAIANAGHGIVPMEVTQMVNFGVFTLNGTAMDIQQYTVVGNNLTTIQDNATTATVSVAAQAAGGMDINSIDLITYNKMAGSAASEYTAFVAYEDNTASNDRYICGLSVSTAGADPVFGTTCSPRLTVQNNGVVKEIKFADIDGDGYDDMFVLAYDSSGAAGSKNTIYIYENKYDTTPGLYQNLDLITLKSDSSLLDFSVKDLDGDGNLDIITNDVEGDLDKIYQGTDTDGSSEGVLSGYTIYFHTGTSDIYNSSTTDTGENTFFYSQSAGHTHTVDIVEDSSGAKLLVNCSISTTVAGDTDVPATTSNTAPSTSTATPLNIPQDEQASCGIVGAF